MIWLKACLGQNRLAQNFLRMFLRDFFDFHTARRARHENRSACNTIDKNAEIQLTLDVEAFFDEYSPDNPPLRPSLRRHEFHPEHLFGEGCGLFRRSCDLHSARFAAPASMDLRLYDDNRRPKARSRCPRFVFAEDGFTARHRHTELGEDGLGLVLVNLHAGIATGQKPAVEMLEFID